MTKTSSPEPSKSKEVTQTGKQLLKSKKSKGAIQNLDKNEQLELADLSAPQSLVLNALLIFPTDDISIKRLGMARGTFYKYKKQVLHLKEKYATQLHEDTFLSMSAAGRLAVLKMISLLDKGSNNFQKDMVDDILDRLGVTKKDPNAVATQPIVQNIIAQKWDKYGED